MAPAVVIRPILLSIKLGEPERPVRAAHNASGRIAGRGGDRIHGEDHSRCYPSDLIGIGQGKPQRTVRTLSYRGRPAAASRQRILGDRLRCTVAGQPSTNVAAATRYPPGRDATMRPP